MTSTKFCKHCGETIDYDCVICPKCGKQVEDLKSADQPIIINNSASSSASSSAASSSGGYGNRLPWYLSTLWIVILGLFTGGIYWIVGPVLRISWRSRN